MQAELYEFPEGWKKLRLKEVIVEVQPGFACGERDPKGYVQLRMNNIGLKGRVVLDRTLSVPKRQTDLTKYKLIPGDVLFNNTNSPDLIGKTVLFRGELDNCVYSNHITRLRINPQFMLPEWLTWFLVTEQRKGTFQMMCRRFVGQAGISQRSLLSVEIPVPSLKEQKHIVEIIGSTFTRAEAAKRFLLESRKSIDKIVPAAVSKAIPTKDPLPEGWEWAKLGEIGKIGQGGTPSRFKREYWNGLIPWLRSGEVRNNIIYNSSEKITEQGLKESSAALCPKGTILIAMTGEGVTRGRVSILGVEAAVNQSCAFLIPDRKIVISEYIWYYLRGQYNKLREMDKGTGQPGMNTTLLKPFKIPLPNLEEQKQIIAYLDSVSKRAEKLKQLNQLALERVEKINSSILSKALRGDLAIYNGKK